MEKWLESVYSDSTRYYVSNPYPKRGDTISINIRIYQDAPVKAVFLKTEVNGFENTIPMEIDRVENNLLYRYCRVTMKEDVFHYHFYIVTENNIYFYNQFEISECMPDETYDFKILVDNNQPKWVKESVFYHIFPDRFYNGDSTLDVKSGEYTYREYQPIHIDDWNQDPDNYKKSRCMDFYNGDLIGIKKKIPYLKALGVNAIYLNPIFLAPSIHKYDCCDYSKVDPHLGGDKAFKELMEELHKNNMKLVLDVSINHTGIEHKWFVKDGTYFDKSTGAYNNPSVPEREYYFFDENNEFYTWAGNKSLPVLNFQSEKLKDLLYRKRDSVIKRWLEPPYKIDGWRFDVAIMMARKDEIQLQHEVWPEIRQAIKQINPNAYILGESWSDCSKFVQGDEWDSAMNYFGFTWPVRTFVGEGNWHLGPHELFSKVSPKMSAKSLRKRIMQHLAKLPTVIQENQFNLLDSHDISRLHNNTNIKYDDYYGAVIMLFTMIGTPNIYYGDEASIKGRCNDIEGCRYPMPWNSGFEETEQFKLYSKLARFKKNIEALKYGGFKIISDEDYVFSYARFTHDELWVTVVSTDDEEREITIPINAFGKTHFSCNEDVLGKKIKYIMRAGDFVLTVPPHTSYLIGF